MSKAAEYNKKYRLNHPEKMEEQRIRQRSLYVKKGRYKVSAEHKREVHRKNSAAWRDKNREKMQEINRKSYLKNKANHQLYKRSYKAKKRAGNDRTIGIKALKELLEKQNNICPLCTQVLDGLKELDHKLPISKGGKHSIENVQWVHRRCNRIKGNKYVL